MKQVDVNNIRLGVFDQGHGRALLLVHGFPLDHSMWRGQIQDLSRDFRVIAPDLRGFGRSGVTDGVVSMEQLADDLASLLDALGVSDKIVLCGLSMGGYVAWQFWRRHRSCLSHLILCDTRAAADPRDAAKARLESADRAMAEGVEFLADTMMGKLFAESTLQDRPDLVEATRTVMLETPAAGVAAALRGMAARSDSTDTLGEIDVPTLIICGQHDTISTADEMQEIARQISGSRYVEVPDAGHMSPLENPTVVNQAIRDFLARDP